MEELVKLVVTNLPNLAGLTLFTWYLARQNTQLINTLLDRIVALEKEIGELKEEVQGLR